MKHVYTILILLLSTFFSYSQQEGGRKCLMEEMTEKNQSKFPEEKSTREAIDFEYTGEYFVIPVVVHVIHQGGVENIPDSRIIDQIDILNQDFGGFGPNNADPRAIDTRIRFCLAKKDPQGNPTTGINRVSSPYADLDSDNEMLTKNLSWWSPKKYLNIWVVKSIDGQSDIQGYSYLPRDTDGPEFKGDGLVIVHTFFGKRQAGFYNLGRTTTHEIGHYLNLLHPWGGYRNGRGDCSDDDGVDDTPNCDGEYYSGPEICRKPKQCGNIRMIENYMDYSYDECMSLFTEGQAAVMRNAIREYRPELVSPENVKNTNCAAYYDSLNAGNINIFPNPLNSYNQKLSIKTFRNINTSNLEVFVYDIYGRMLYENMFFEVGVQTTEIELPYLRPGMYILKIYYSGKTFKEKIIVN